MSVEPVMYTCTANVCFNSKDIVCERKLVLLTRYMNVYICVLFIRYMYVQCIFVSYNSIFSHARVLFSNKKLIKHVFGI